MGKDEFVYLKFCSKLAVRLKVCYKKNFSRLIEHKI
jgi:hypothetical protein